MKVFERGPGLPVRALCLALARLARAAIVGLLAAPAIACDTALLLAIDVSRSIDAAEYRLQTQGMRTALRDPDIADALVQGQVALSVVQWSGVERQQVSLPWTRMTNAAEVAAFAEAAGALPRAFAVSNTAVGDAMDFAGAAFGPVSDCLRRVIDISGDGQDNAGTPPAHARRAAERAGIQINAIAIEAVGLSITTYYRRQVITSDGFVMTARGHRDYPRTLKAKIAREVSRALF